MDRESINQYDKEPVVYCTKCGSLKIMSLGGYDYCDSCGSTDIAETDIFTWKALQKGKFNNKSF